MSEANESRNEPRKESIKVFQLRMQVEYGDDETFSVQKFDAENGRWQALAIHEKTPGLLIFLYSVLTCQHLFLRNPAKQAGLEPVRTEAELLARFDKSRFRFESIHTRFLVHCRVEPACQQAQAIAGKMENCPVSNNLHPAIDKQLSLEFVLAASPS